MVTSCSSYHMDLICFGVQDLVPQRKNGLLSPSHENGCYAKYNSMQEDNSLSKKLVVKSSNIASISYSLVADYIKPFVCSVCTHIQYLEKSKILHWLHWSNQISKDLDSYLQEISLIQSIGLTSFLSKASVLGFGNAMVIVYVVFSHFLVMIKEIVYFHHTQ